MYESRQKRMKLMFLFWLLGSSILPFRVDAQSDRAEKTGEEQQDDEMVSAMPLLGMEAYREVIESGNYVVGGGDEFLIFTPGIDYPIMNSVSAEGGLFIPKVGNVAVAGLSLSEARKTVQARFAEVVRVGELTIELNRPRSFPVTVIGMVQTPGIYTANGVERVSQVIARAGGLLQEASRREIQLVKMSSLKPAQRERLARFMTLGMIPDDVSTQEMKRVDFDMYEVAGQSRFNPFLEDGDVVIAKAPSGRVGSFGALKRTGFYDYVPGDKLSDLLHLSMGVSIDIDSSNVRLFRFEKDNKTRVSLSVDMKALLAGDRAADWVLRPNDWLNVGSLPEFHPRSEVSIRGEVKFPGYYVIGPEGMKLRDLVDLAGGFNERSSLAEARIVRSSSDGNSGQLQMRINSVDPEYERIRTVPVADRTEDENQYFIMKSRERVGHMSVDWNRLFVLGDERHNIPLLPGDAFAVWCF